jgi:hypothetical protein
MRDYRRKRPDTQHIDDQVTRPDRVTAQAGQGEAKKKKIEEGRSTETFKRIKRNEHEAITEEAYESVRV